MKRSSKNIIGLDIETTGLYPSRHKILEVSAMVLTWDLDILEHYTAVVAYSNIDELNRVINQCDPSVYQMHLKSGLIAALLDDSETTPLDSIEKNIVHMAAKFDAIGGPLFGNSPHFDKSFARVHMPSIPKLFSHRFMNVSSFRDWQLAHGAELPVEESNHRAADDLLRCVRLMQYMRGMPIA